MIIVVVLLGFSIGYNIYQHKEIKRLDKCWDEVFNAKLESDSRWGKLCNHYLERIDELLEQKEAK